MEWLIIIALGGFFYWRYQKKQARKAIEASPFTHQNNTYLATKLGQQKYPKIYGATGPMKVDLAEKPIQAPSVSHSLEGGPNWWRLFLNIQLSQ
jgi:hypothetical protein